MNNSLAVIDSNIAIFVLILSEQTEPAFLLLKRLREKKVSLRAPRLWAYEVTTGIHKYLHANIIQRDVADEAITASFGLGVNLMDETPALCLSASHWATRLNQMAAYDGFYLAAAESLDAPLWTGDKRLVNTAMQLGLSWVHWMGDLE